MIITPHKCTYAIYPATTGNDAVEMVHQQSELVESSYLSPRFLLPAAKKHWEGIAYTKRP